MVQNESLFHLLICLIGHTLIQQYYVTGTVQGSKDLKINRMQSFRMVEETDTSKASKCSVRKMVERQTDIMEEQRRAWHRGSIRKGFLSRRCLHLLLNQEWELTTLGGCSRQRDQHKSIKKNRGVRGATWLQKQYDKENDSLVRDSRGPPDDGGLRVDPEEADSISYRCKHG